MHFCMKKVNIVGHHNDTKQINSRYNGSVDATIMEPPTEPNLEDCCNSGCNPCIFDIYEQQLKLYKFGKGSSKEKRENGIYELKYSMFILVSTKLLCDSQKILNFRKYNNDDTEVWWRPGQHFLYKFVGDNLSCTRAYTPIKLNSDKNEDFDFSIVVKCYDNGLVSNHLFKLHEGELTLWRGPYGTYKIEPNKFSRIIMIAQGTGIAPFITIIESILNNEDDMTKIFLFYCCQSIGEILFRDELCFYRSYWNFSYEVYITNFTSNIDIRYQEPIMKQKFSCKDLNRLKPYSNNQFLICGSSKFMEFYNDALRHQLELVENIVIF